MANYASAWHVLAALFLLMLSLAYTNAEIFSSMDQLIQVTETETPKVLKRLEDFLFMQEQKLKTAKNVIKNFKSMSNQFYKNPKQFMGNPVNSYLMIKMLTKDMHSFFHDLSSHEESQHILNEMREQVFIPTEEDYKGATIALQRLEDTYLLTPADIRKALECYEFGKVAHENDDNYHAIRWLNEALELTETDTSVSKIAVMDLLAISNFKQGNVNKAFELTQKILKIDPNNQKALTDLIFFRRYLFDMLVEKIDFESESETIQLNKKDLFGSFKNERTHSYLGTERDRYEKLCRGELSKDNIKRMSKLKCRYINYHPLLKIAPVKQEQVFDDPPILVFHDVLSEKQAQRMINLARPKLDRARIASEDREGKGKVSNIRISKNGWIYDQEDSSLQRLSKVVGAITNLSIEYAEAWQMNNYGLGGVYEPHEDFSRKGESDKWDNLFGLRIATWMFYIEAPEQGGATVFPSIGARVSPTNRSAVFWYNLLPSGEGDYRTRHAACPVLVGSKWVSNKWVRSKGQELNRPCTLVHENNEEDYMVRF